MMETALASKVSLQTRGETGIPNLMKIIDGLMSAIQEETQAFRANLGFDLKASNARKSRLLYELTRAAGNLDLPGLQHDCRAKLLLLKNELAGNALQVKAHMMAVKEISDLMIDILRKEQEDGTYSKRGYDYAS